MATKKSPKKDDKTVPYMELIEIAHCNMVERGVADKSMCLIYQKISDSESKTVYIYQGTDVRLLHKIERLKNKNKNYVPPDSCWISLWNAYADTAAGLVPWVVVKHISESLDGIIKNMTDSKTKSIRTIRPIDKVKNIDKVRKRRAA
jgi:hypothetical protein